MDLRTLQELAGHSTPVLTAHYSHRRLHDLAGAVEKLPRLLPDRPPAEALHATEADASASLDESVCTGFVQTNDIGCNGLRLVEAQIEGEREKQTGLNSLLTQEVEAGCDRVRAAESRAGDGIRTCDVSLGN
jgi:hypothetical protein